MPRKGRRMVGKCYNCQGAVDAFAARHVADVFTMQGRDGRDHVRTVNRLVHRGRCEAELRTRLSFGKPKGDAENG